MKTGKYYYYAKEKKRFKCINIGDILSVFTDEMGVEYQFYNNDMFEEIWRR